MLILVAVTVSYSIKSGMLDKAKDGGAQETSSQEKEQIGSLYQEYLVEKETEKLGTTTFSEYMYDKGLEGATITKVDDNTVTVEFATSGNAYTVTNTGTITATAGSSTGNGNNTTSEVPDELVDYLLGADHQGRNLKEINEWDWDNKTFEFLEEKNFNSTNVSLIMNGYGYPIEFSTTVYYDEDEGNQIDEEMVYCSYEGTAYRFLVKNIYNDDSDEYYTAPIDSNTTIAVAYEPDTSSRVGKYVYWDIDGDGNVEDDNELWIVLYDDTTNGLQIISANTIPYDKDELYLGYNDTYLTKNDSTFATMPSSDIEERVAKSIYSYNNAITTLNKACASLISDTTKVAKDENGEYKIRCVGSNPTDSSDKSGKYSSNNLESWNATYNGVGKTGDLNGLTDYDRMLGLGIAVSKNEEDYWLASRCVHEYYSGVVLFSVRLVRTGGGCSRYDLWDTYESDADGSYSDCELRPVVTLKSGTQLEGDGTIYNPCTINN